MAKANKTIEPIDCEIVMETGDLTRLFIQCDAADTDLINTIKKYSNEFYAIDIDKEEWKSKYNSYVIYDDRPFAIEGFYYRIYFRGRINELKFLEYMLNKYIKQTNNIINSYNLEEVTDATHK